MHIRTSGYICTTTCNVTVRLKLLRSLWCGSNGFTIVCMYMCVWACVAQRPRHYRSKYREWTRKRIQIMCFSAFTLMIYGRKLLLIFVLLCYTKLTFLFRFFLLALFVFFAVNICIHWIWVLCSLAYLLRWVWRDTILWNLQVGRKQWGLANNLRFIKLIRYAKATNLGKAEAELYWRSWWVIMTFIFFCQL